MSRTAKKLRREALRRKRIGTRKYKKPAKRQSTLKREDATPKSKKRIRVKEASSKKASPKVESKEEHPEEDSKAKPETKPEDKPEDKSKDKSKEEDPVIKRVKIDESKGEETDKNKNTTKQNFGWRGCP